MLFSKICMGIVITLAISIVTAFVGYWFDTDDEIPVVSWIISTLGFALSFFLLLLEKGII